MSQTRNLGLLLLAAISVAAACTDYTDPSRSCPPGTTRCPDDECRECCDDRDCQAYEFCSREHACELTALVVTEEYEIGQPDRGPAAGSHSGPQLAWGESCGLVAWSEFGPWYSSEHWPPQVLATRLGQDGQPLDPYPFTVFAGELVYHACVSWDGASFLVAWASEPAEQDTSVLASRVSPEGEVLDAQGIPIATVSSDLVDLAAVWNGTSHLVFWNESDGIRGARVSPEGTVLDRPPLSIPDSSAASGRLAVSSDGAVSMLVWGEWGSDASVQLVRIGPGGEILDPHPTTLFAGLYVSAPAIAHTGEHFLVAWSATGQDHERMLHLKLVSPDGEAVDADGFPIRRDTSGCDLACSGSGCLLSWEEIRDRYFLDLEAACLSADGQLVAGSEFTLPATLMYEGRARTAWTGISYITIWSDRSDCAKNDLFAARSSAGCELVDAAGIPVAVGLSQMLAPSVAWSGERFFATWMEVQGGAGPDIFGATVDRTPVDPASDEHTLATEPLFQLFPAIAWDGSSFLVVWSEQSCDGDYAIAVSGVRVRPDGSLADGGQALLSLPGLSPAVACAADSCLIALSEDADVVYATVGRDQPLGELATQHVTFSPYEQLTPAVASNGESYMLAWVDRGQMSLPKIRVAPIGLAHEVGLINDVSVSAGSHIEPDLASDGSSYLVVWVEDRAGDERSSVVAARVEQNGAVLDPGGIRLSAEGQLTRYPAVAWGGSCHLVIWEQEVDQGDWRLYATRVSREGLVLDTPFELASISSVGIQEVGPSLVSDGADLWLITYHRKVEGAPYPVFRIFGRFLQLDRESQPPLADSPSGSLGVDKGLRP
ncbi:MAG: hypothetical protein JXR96_14920 [Deltaproteobacteria bacterium]|nr:hypothetical protein [Deltaproteobacteria bacterium]